MQAHHLRGTARRRRKRLGRGIGSRRGTYSGRGVKGQKARAGARLRPGFEGGRTPLYSRLPKRRGFRSRHPKAKVVNVEVLEGRFPQGATVDRRALIRAGVVPADAREIKILGDGEIRTALTLRGVAVSASAREKIEKAGGKVE